MPIPLHILTGFLGAGKSTVLSRLLAEGTGERVAVLVNEVGELSIDHHLLHTVDGDEALLLASGCVCCTLHGELFAAIERALTLHPDRIVLETTGLANPAPIASGLAKHPRLKHQVQLAGIVAVVDAVRGEFCLDAPEAKAQVQLADRVVISKVDLAPSRVAALRDKIATYAPDATLCEAAEGEVSPAWLLAGHPVPRWAQSGENAVARTGLGEDGDGEVHAHAHGAEGHDAHTQVLDLPNTVNLAALELWMSITAQLDGHLLLRAKGIVRCEASGRLYVLQSVEHDALSARPLASEATGWAGSKLVLISRGASAAQRERWARYAQLAARGEARRTARPEPHEAEAHIDLGTISPEMAP